MKNKLVLFITSILCFNVAFSQIIFLPIPIDKVKSDYEHGFLPGGKFPIYPPIIHYNFNNLKIRVVLFDNRFSLNLNKIKCSDIEITNTSEYSVPNTIYKFKEYVEYIFSKSNIIIDSISKDILEISLEAVDSRLIGFGYIEVHGLCQVKIKYKEYSRTYCVDIKDGDSHSPIGKFSFVTRRSATRKMTSAALREIIEQILFDIKDLEGT